MILSRSFLFSAGGFRFDCCIFNRILFVLIIHRLTSILSRIRFEKNFFTYFFSANWIITYHNCLCINKYVWLFWGKCWISEEKMSCFVLFLIYFLVCCLIVVHVFNICKKIWLYFVEIKNNLQIQINYILMQ